MTLRTPKLALLLMTFAALAPTARAAPPNDSISSPIVIPWLPYTDSGSNVGATTDFLEPAPCGGIAATVWYSLTPPVPGSSVAAIADTFGSNFDTVLAVYAYVPGGPLVPIVLDCNDDAAGLQSRVTWVTAPGVSYYIQLGGYFGATGNYELHVFPNP